MECKYTLESLYKKMVKDGSEKWAGYIKAYDAAFYEELFLEAVEHSVKDGHGIGLKFGQNQHTLEHFYTQMLRLKETDSALFGCEKLNACMKAYENAFPEDAFKAAIKQSVMHGDGEHHKVTTHLGTDLLEDLGEVKSMPKGTRY